jgi:glutathione S-transferase
MLTYTASLLGPTSTWTSTLVPLAVVLYLIEHMVMGGFVGQARTKYGIPYPSMYAIPGTPRYYDESMKPKENPMADTISNEDAFAFNRVQRGHQNMIENAPFFLALLLVAWPFPLIAGIAGLAYVAGRALYFYGYMQSVGSRIYGAVLIYPALFTLLGLAIATMVHVVKGTAAY